VKAYILAAGFGKRLRPLTNRLPKALLPFLNRPLVSYLLAHLRSHVVGMRLNVGYNGEPLIEYLQGISGVSYFNEGPEPLGSATTIGLEREYFDGETALICCGDLLCDWNVEQMAAFHRKHQALATIAVRWVADPRPYGVVVSGPDQRVRAFYEKPTQPPGHWISCGIYLISPRIFQYWQPHWQDLGTDVFPALVQAGLGVYAWPMNTEAIWSDIGTPQAYLRSHLVLSRGQNVVEPTAQVAPGAVLNQTTVGAHSTIGPQAHLRRCVVWPGTTIKAGTHLEQAVITPYEVVRVDDTLLTVRTF